VYIATAVSTGVLPEQTLAKQTRQFCSSACTLHLVLPPFAGVSALPFNRQNCLASVVTQPEIN